MALYYDLPVYRDSYKLILKIFECTKDFQRDNKVTLNIEFIELPKKKLPKQSDSEYQIIEFAKVN